VDGRALRAGARRSAGRAKGEGGGEGGARRAGWRRTRPGGPHCSTLYGMGGEEGGAGRGGGENPRRTGSPSSEPSECAGGGQPPGGVRPTVHPSSVRPWRRASSENRNLDASRRASLAAAAGVQPRQVAIWFQNRRARACGTSWPGQQVQSHELQSTQEMIGALLPSIEQRYECLKQDHKRVLEQNANLRCQVCPGSVWYLGTPSQPLLPTALALLLCAH